MLTTTSTDAIALDAQHVLQVYRRVPVVFDHGEGSALFTRAGERYLVTEDRDQYLAEKYPE